MNHSEISKQKGNSMRYMIVVVVAVTLALADGASAQESRHLRSISVTGTVETKTAPDQIVWRISLVDRDPNMWQQPCTTARSGVRCCWVDSAIHQVSRKPDSELF